MLVAPDVVTVVRHAGGWVFDQVLVASIPGAWPQGLAVECGLYARLSSVRRMVDDAVAGGVSALWSWEAGAPAEPGCDAAGGHRLSVAARAFKAQALAAAAEPFDVIGAIELFRTGEPPVADGRVTA